MTEKKKNHLIRYIAAAALIFSVICNVVCLALLLKPESSSGDSVSGEESRFINIQAVEGEVSKLSWAGKTWCSYGDSITQEEKWQSYVTEYFGFEKHYNRGIGSSTFAQSDQVWYANEDGSYNSRPGFDGVTEAPEGTTEHEGYLCSSDRIDVSIPEDADLVVVFGGTNDFGHWSTKEELTAHCSAHLSLIAETYAGKHIFVITPIWRDRRNGQKLGSFEECRAIIAGQAEKLGLTVIDGLSLVPPLPAFFSDGYLHPNDCGMSLYAENLICSLEKYIK